jgi:putative ATPase
MDLFDRHLETLVEAEAPLAARMRPRTLDDFIGQNAIVGPGRLLRRAIQADQLTSLIFYGPPGTGKTTLAQIIANTTQAHFIAINAVLSGVKEIRAAIDSAQTNRKLYHQRTILFVDEVHRFNKSQQDALLPWVENGTVTLIGATTENPYFEVNKALVSRSRLFQLRPLDAEDLKQIVAQALANPDRGFGQRSVVIEPAAIDHLVNIANGDARTLLNAIELAVATTLADHNGVITISLTIAEESIQRRAVLYDKEGDAHFDTISAFIKSLRGSDPDAAMYWLARMVHAGEDSRFILRRMLIFAGEDVGMADPQAVVIVNACAQAFDRVGLPEGRYPLAQAALYLATCAKSNSVMGFFDALSAIEQEQEAAVPVHLRDSSRDKEGFGHGAGYLYPHAYRDHWVEQQYLPGRLQGRVFYQPSGQGYEAQIHNRVHRLREAQLAALVEGLGDAPPENLTLSPKTATIEQWRQRTLDETGDRLAQIRDRIFQIAAPQRHHLILDLNARSGLLTWEALRQVPEGGVYTCVAAERDRIALVEQAAVLPELLRPLIVPSHWLELSVHLDPALRFDAMIGRNVLMTEPDKAAVIQAIQPYLSPHGQIILAEAIPQKAQRLYQLIAPDRWPPKLLKKLQQAEEKIYARSDDPKVNWDETTLATIFHDQGFTAKIMVEPNHTRLLITASLLDRWFCLQSAQPSYADQVRPALTAAEWQTVEQTYRQQLLNQRVDWQSYLVFVQACIKP